MTWLFVRFYVSVLIVLFLAWCIHSSVLKQRADADLARVIVTAHGGGARLVASELDAARPDGREQRLESLRKRFDYPVDVLELTEVPSAIQRQVRDGADVAYLRTGNSHCVVAALSDRSEVVRLGPFPDYQLRQVEESIGGWMRLTADKLDATVAGDRPKVLDDLQKQFDFPIAMASREDLPEWPRTRIDNGTDVVFYSASDDRSFAVAPMSDGAEVIRFGPFPSFERIEQKAATTTLAFVLLPAAFVIALLLRPVARQLRHVENAAKAIAAGDLNARVDERRVRSARPLVQAFNNMAHRTETLVRTQRELLQAVSHELRTPLSRMKFAVDLIATAKDHAERQRRIESLNTATDELDELVGELLCYARMESAQPQLDKEPIALQETLDVLIPKYAALHPAIQFDMNESALCMKQVILGDRNSFQRAIGNLLGNASRFAKSQVTVNAESGDGFITVDVDDDGCGIPAPERDRVFEPFVRLNENQTGPGAGLGLALVKRIVSQHGGSVEVLSTPLGGCRIRTKWPASTTSS